MRRLWRRSSYVGNRRCGNISIEGDVCGIIARCWNLLGLSSVAEGAGKGFYATLCFIGLSGDYALIPSVYGKIELFVAVLAGAGMPMLRFVVEPLSPRGVGVDRNRIDNRGPACTHRYFLRIPVKSLYIVKSQDGFAPGAIF